MKEINRKYKETMKNRTIVNKVKQGVAETYSTTILKRTAEEKVADIESR